MADQWQDHSILNAQIRDDDDDIPDDWENESEEKPKKSNVEEKSKATVKAPATTKNKLTKKKYAADEHLSDEEFLESLKEPDRKYTPEELEELTKRAELQQEVAKLNMASDFVGNSGERNSLDNINLITKDEFLDYSFRLWNRLELLSKSEFYPEFLDHLVNGLTKPLSVEGVKHMSATLHSILLRKQNEKKTKELSRNTLGNKQQKLQLNVERRTEYDSFLGEGITGVDNDPEYDEDNDFM